MYCTEEYTPNQFEHTVLSDVTNEVLREGYDLGGREISSVAFNVVDNAVVLNGEDVEWTESTISARYAVIYNDFGAKPLIGFIDFGEVKSSSNSIFRIRFDQGGILRMVIE